VTSGALSVVHFSRADNSGGSARAAYKIHRGLRRLGHASRMLVEQKVTFDRDVDTVHGGGVGRAMDRLAEELTSRLGLQYLYVPSRRRVLAHPWVRAASVFQLYNIHGGYFSLRMLPHLATVAPVVWRLSDMWPMTGHCAYSGPCQRWREGCGRCPDLTAYPPVPFDTTAFLFRQKARVYRRSDITVVAPSSWTERLARESPLLGRFPIHRVATGVDLDVFRPLDRAMVRTLLEIPPSATVLLFAAQELDANPRKGAEFLVEALRRIGPATDLMLVLVGIGGESWRERVPQPIKLLGYVTDDRLLAAAYSAADIVVAPSMLENLPNAVLEAIACGVPAVAFDTGGTRDAARHMETGYLARSGDVRDLERGIRLLLGDDALRRRLGDGGRRLAVAEFGADRQARRFADLYADVVGRRRREAAARDDGRDALE
jgi:glycosyltransferase involved in cell wall biosynthesis